MADGSTFGLQASDENIIEILGERTGSLDIRGKRNRVFIGQGARFDGQIDIVGDDNVVEIGAWGSSNATYLGIHADHSRIDIGEGSSVIHSAVHVYEAGAISIGKNTAVSANCWLSNTDMHPMYDGDSGERINPPRDIMIGDHAWIGLRSIILKGSIIEDGGIVGAGSTVSGRVPAKTAVGGNPARLIRENVEWKWDFPTQPA